MIKKRSWVIVWDPSIKQRKVYPNRTVFIKMHILLYFAGCAIDMIYVYLHLLPQNTELVKTVEDLKQQLHGQGDSKTSSGEQQKVGSPGSATPSHTHPRLAAPRHQVPFGEDDEQVIPVLFV